MTRRRQATTRTWGLAGTALLLGAARLATGGCVTSVLASRLVTAPNRQGSASILNNPKTAEQFDKTYAQAWMVPVGPPPARLSVAAIEPGDYKLKHNLEAKISADGSGSFTYSMNWVFRPADAPVIAPKGTIVLLHGILVSKEYMIHWALDLAQRGYRTILVDLRGHGRSTGRWITFGAVESHDLKLVLDDLQKRGLAGDRVGVLGISYGAVVGLEWAAQDARVATVVALEPYSNARQAIIEFSRGYYAGQVKGVTNAQFETAEAKAARMAGFAWDDADVLCRVRQLRVPVLFYHGAADAWIPPVHSERLLDAAPKGSRRVVLPNENHLTLAVRLDPMAPEVAAWFQEHLPPGKH